MAIYLYKQSFTYASFGKGSATGWVMVMVSGLIAAAYLGFVGIGVDFDRMREPNA